MTGKKVGLRDVARGVLRAAPELAGVSKSTLLRLATLRPHSKQSIGRVIEHWARWAPARVALRTEDRLWSYAEFNGWVNRIAACFAAHGVGSGDRVAILMENRAEVLACVAAAVKLGAIAGMLNHNQRGDVLAHSVKLVKPKILVLSAECREAIETTEFTPAETTDIVYLWHGGDQKEAAPAGWLDLARESGRRSSTNPKSTKDVVANQPCYYIFTSGTTGLPKASVMTHYRWLSSMGGVGSVTLRMKGSDIFYCCLPLYHNNALTISWSAVLSAGATLALDRKFSASKFWDRIRLFDATAFCYIGELLRYLLNRPASPGDRDHRVRLITGNGLRPEIWGDFETRFNIQRIYEFYGASESNIAFINAFGVSQTAGFTPMSFAIVEFDNDTEEPIRDKKGFMKKVKKGGVGLLVSEVSARRPFDGYTDPAAGEKKLFRDVFKKGDTWFNSGDLVRDQGLRHIQFVDRVGDTFRWKGENVSTSEVSEAIGGFPGIAEANVYGVGIPNRDGRAGMAALVADGEIDLKALREHLAGRLPDYARPVFLRIRDELDVTGTFKQKKIDLVREGFDPSATSDAIFFHDPEAHAFVRLDAPLYDRIVAGKVRV
jgi:acyl-CoA synthetase (AMP-forming)/AMP-acid ligase II